MKRKKRKSISKFSEKNTLKMLRNVIIIFIIISIVFEFIPDVCNIYKIFDDNIFVGFFLIHKDFFINVVLGCLGSAIISYFILYLSIKTNEKEKKEILIVLSKKAISEYLRLISYLADKRVTEKRDLRIKNINSRIDVYINEFSNHFHQYDKDDYIFKELHHFLLVKILPINNEINIFLEELQKSLISSNYINKKNYEKAMNKIYKDLYNTLNDEYSLDAILEKIDYFSAYIGWNLKREITMNDTNDLVESVRNKRIEWKHIKYSKMINDIL